MSSSPKATSMEKVYAELGLVHAQTCSNANCELTSCKHLKSLRAHTMQCSRGGHQHGDNDQVDVESKVDEQTTSVNGTCSTCIEYWDLVKLHAKTCKEPNCIVEKCKLLRPSGMRKKLMVRVSHSKSGSSMEMSASVASSVADSVGGSMLMNGSGTVLLAKPKPFTSVLSGPKKLQDSEVLSEIDSDDEDRIRSSSSPEPKVSSASPLKSKGSFIKVGANNKEVPILEAHDAYSRTALDHGAPTNMANPMYAEDEEMGQIPRRKTWFSCGI
jgi:hypothetical protein